MTKEENIIMCANNLKDTRAYLAECKKILKPSTEVGVTLVVMDELYRMNAEKIAKEYEEEQRMIKDFITFMEERGLE